MTKNESLHLHTLVNSLIGDGLKASHARQLKGMIDNMYPPPPEPEEGTYSVTGSVESIDFNHEQESQQEECNWDPRRLSQDEIIELYNNGTGREYS